MSIIDRCVNHHAAVKKLLILRKKKPRESVSERTIFMPEVAKISENSAIPSIKSFIKVTPSIKNL